MLGSKIKPMNQKNLSTPCLRYGKPATKLPHTGNIWGPVSSRNGSRIHSQYPITPIYTGWRKKNVEHTVHAQRKTFSPLIFSANMIKVGRGLLQKFW